MACTKMNQPVEIEAIVKKVIMEMARDKNVRNSSSLPENDGSQLEKKKKKTNSKKHKKKKRKSSSKKKEKRPSTNSLQEVREERLRRTSELVGTIGSIMSELGALRGKEARKLLAIPSQVTMQDRTISDRTIGFVHDDDLSDLESACNDDDETMCTSNSSSTISTVGTSEFFRAIATRLKSKNGSICIQGDYMPTDEEIKSDQNLSEQRETTKFDDDDFDAAFAPEDMRCLALVSHNEMKATMRDFVVQHKNVLKKFRLTGTQSTMKMLAEVFADEPGIVFGPSCQSGPLGGDAELVALMAQGELGGILFFQDPMTSHPHQADIQCLVRQAIVHNTLIANTPTTAMSIMEIFRLALRGPGRAQLIPSFFFSLQSPTVQSYKNTQSQVIRECSTYKPVQ